LTTRRRDWQKPFETLRDKWIEIPTSRSGRRRTIDLIKLSDEKLLAEWMTSREDITTGSQFSHRGWYHTLYADGMRGKEVLDIGCGFGIDGITFAQHGAKVTFVDLAESNLLVVQRLCKMLGLRNTRFLLLQDINSLGELHREYDVIMAMGSLHHAPFEVIKPEAYELLKHLKIGGRWLQLAYPKTRWIKAGKPPFDKWGEMTDGIGTPWAEWYDSSKLLELLRPARLEVVLCLEFHNSNFIWFDLLFEGWDTEDGGEHN